MKAKKVNESLGDVLKPKSWEELYHVIVDLIDGLDKDFTIEQVMRNEDGEGRMELEKLAKWMNSDPKDVLIVSENEESEYEKMENVLRMMIVKMGKPDYFHFEDREWDYAVSRHNKIAFGSNKSMGALNALFFNKPFVLDTLKKYHG